MIITEGIRRSGQGFGHATRIKPRKQMSTQGISCAHICRQIPVMPAMVSTESNLVFSCVGTSDPDCYGHCLAASPCITYHPCPRVKLAQQFSQFHFFRTVQSATAPIPYRLHDGGIHVRISIAEDVCANAANAHVNVAVSIQIPYFNTFCLAVVSRPHSQGKLIRAF